MRDALDELFLTKEEEKKYWLEKLSKQFILSEEELLKKLEIKAYESIENAKIAITSYKNYKDSLGNLEREKNGKIGKN